MDWNVGLGFGVHVQIWGGGHNKSKKRVQRLYADFLSDGFLFVYHIRSVIEYRKNQQWQRKAALYDALIKWSMCRILIHTQIQPSSLSSSPPSPSVVLSLLDSLLNVICIQREGDVNVQYYINLVFIIYVRKYIFFFKKKCMYGHAPSPGFIITLYSVLLHQRTSHPFYPKMMSSWCGGHVIYNVMVHSPIGATNFLKVGDGRRTTTDANPSADLKMKISKIQIQSPSSRLIVPQRMMVNREV